METKNQLISTLISTQKQSLWKELNPYCQELNKKKKIEEKNVVHKAGNQKTQKHIQLYHLIAPLKIQYSEQYAKYSREKEHPEWNYKYD